MPWSVPIALNNVFEVTMSWRSMDQLIQLKWDAVFGGTGGPITSDQYMTQLNTSWQIALTTRMSDTCTHVQTRVQRIDDCLLVGGKPKRIRSLLDKSLAVAGNDGTAAGPHLPIDVTASIQMITGGSPRAFWGRKSFGQLPADTIEPDGEAIVKLTQTALNTAAEAFWATTIPIAGTTMNVRHGLLPTTYVARAALPHAGMDTYFLPFDGCQTGDYVGSQATRRVSPQSFRAH